MKHWPWLIAILLSFSFLLAGCATSPAVCGNSTSGIVITDAWARPTTGMTAAPVTSAAYLVLTNCAKADDQLLKVESAAAGTAEIHKSEMQGGMMSMSPVENLTIPAGKQVVFKPGELHVMLMDIKQELALGQTIKLSFTFAKAGQVSIEAPVKNQE